MAARPQPQDHRRKLRPTEIRVSICDDGDARSALLEARNALYDAEHPRDGDPDLEVVEGARQDLEAAEAAAREVSVLYVFRSIGRKAWRALIDEHPPTEDEIADADAEYQRRKAAGEDIEASAVRPDWNGDTFPQAALSACCIEPGLTEAEADELLDQVSDLEASQLLGAAVVANMTSRVVDLGKGSGPTRSTGRP